MIVLICSSSFANNYRRNIFPCSFAGVVHLGPPSGPRSALKSPMMITSADVGSNSINVVQCLLKVICAARATGKVY